MESTWAIVRGTKIDGGAPGKYILMQFADEESAREVCRFLNRLYDGGVFSEDSDAESILKQHLAYSGIKWGYDEGGHGEFYVQRISVVESADKAKSLIRDLIGETVDLDNLSIPTVACIRLNFAAQNDGPGYYIGSRLKTYINKIILGNSNEVYVQKSNISFDHGDEYSATLKISEESSITVSDIREFGLGGIQFVNGDKGITISQIWNIRIVFSDNSVKYITRDERNKIRIFNHTTRKGE